MGPQQSSEELECALSMSHSVAVTLGWYPSVCVCFFFPRLRVSVIPQQAAAVIHAQHDQTESGLVPWCLSEAPGCVRAQPEVCGRTTTTVSPRRAESHAEPTVKVKRTPRVCVKTARGPHLTVVTLHMVVLVHRNYPDGFLRALVGHTYSKISPVSH